VPTQRYLRYLTERKKKKKEKLRQKRDEAGDGPITPRAGPAEAPKADCVKFGEVAQDIPHFTTLPKPAKKLAAARAAAASARYGEDGALAEPSAAAKRILEEERQRVIEHYRKLKLARMLSQLPPASK